MTIALLNVIGVLSNPDPPARRRAGEEAERLEERGGESERQRSAGKGTRRRVTERGAGTRWRAGGGRPGPARVCGSKSRRVPLWAVVSRRRSSSPLALFRTKAGEFPVDHRIPESTWRVAHFLGSVRTEKMRLTSSEDGFFTRELADSIFRIGDLPPLTCRASHLKCANMNQLTFV